MDIILIWFAISINAVTVVIFLVWVGHRMNEFLSTTKPKPPPTYKRRGDLL